MKLKAFLIAIGIAAGIAAPAEARRWDHHGPGYGGPHRGWHRPPPPRWRGPPPRRWHGGYYGRPRGYRHAYRGNCRPVWRYGHRQVRCW